MNEWILDHLPRCNKCVVTESTENTGKECCMCGHIIAHYESSYNLYVCHPYNKGPVAMCYHCAARVSVQSHRQATIEEFSDKATEDFRKTILDF